MTRYKLGALAPVRPYGLSELAVYAAGKLPTAPPCVDVPNPAPSGMMVNDRLGCCTVSGVGHAIQAWNVEVGVSDHVPNDPEVETTYMDLAGGVDSGCVEADVLQRWQRQGLFGHQIAGYAPVRPGDVHQPVAFYGAAYLGVALPMSAQEQFAAGDEWTVEPGSPIEGGHCIVAVGYDQHTVQCVTWGAVVNVSYPWLASYCTETWAIIPHEFTEAGRGPRLDLASLRADLAAL